MLLHFLRTNGLQEAEWTFRLPHIETSNSPLLSNIPKDNFLVYMTSSKSILDIYWFSQNEYPSLAGEDNYWFIKPIGIR